MVVKFNQVKGIKLIFILAFLFSGFLTVPATAAKKDCTNAEKALIVNLRQQIVTLSNQISFFKTRLLSATEKYTSSGGGLTYKAEMENWTAQVKLNGKSMQSKEQQILQITNKCNFSSSGSSTSSKRLKNCTASEKKAISAVVANFTGVQSNKRSWGEKLKVAQTWASDYSKPAVIRAQALFDVKRYSDLYQEESAIEQLIIEQFNLLNSSCSKSGYILPRIYQTQEEKQQEQDSINKLNPNIISSFVNDKSFVSNGISGGFSISFSNDSLVVNCRNGTTSNTEQAFTYAPVDFTGAKLFLAGSKVKDTFIGYYWANSFPKNWIVAAQTILPVAGKQESYKGKHITFINKSNDICGLVTEKLSNLKSTFATDVESVSLLLKLDENIPLNNNFVDRGSYIFLGGALIPTASLPLKPSTSVKRQYTQESGNEIVIVECGIPSEEAKRYIWLDQDGGRSKNIESLSQTTLVGPNLSWPISPNGPSWPVRQIGKLLPDYYYGTRLSSIVGPNAYRAELFPILKDADLKCEFNLVGLGGEKINFTEIVPALNK